MQNIHKKGSAIVWVIVIILAIIIIFVLTNKKSDEIQKEQPQANESYLTQDFYLNTIKNLADQNISYAPISLEDQILINDLVKKTTNPSSAGISLGEIQYLQNVIKEAESSVQDAPSGRSLKIATTKVCYLDAYNQNDLKNILNYCDLPKSVVWDNNNVDDLTAVSQVFPYFIAGMANQEDNNVLANQYLQIVLDHQTAGVGWLGESFFDGAGESYKEITREVEEILNK